MVAHSRHHPLLDMRALRVGTARVCDISEKLPEPPPRTQGKDGLEGRSQRLQEWVQAPAFPFLLKEYFPVASG